MTDAPKPLIGEPYEPDEFFRALGYALVTFSEIEESLFRLFHALASNEISDIKTTGTVLSTFENFRPRLSLVTNLIKAKITDVSLLSEWKTIASEVVELSRERNLMAHRRRLR